VRCEGSNRDEKMALEIIESMEQKLARADARIAELETAMKRQAAAVKMIDMSHVRRAETMMQHAQVLHDQSNAAALESEREANAMLTERIAELEQSVTVRDTEIARLETDLELARRDAERYRWIRDSDNEGPISAGNATAFGEYGFERVEWFYDDELDAAVDAARAGNGGEG
jgi:hypothetical protein